VSATATDPAGNTSEFARDIVESIGQFSYSMSTYEDYERSGYALITIVRVGGSGGYATVQYKVANGTAKLGYVPSPDANYGITPGATPEPTPPGVLPTYFIGTAIFDIGVSQVTFAIPLLNDGYPGDLYKTVNLSLQNSTGPASIGDPATAILKIFDDDPYSQIAFSSSQYEVNELQGTITITVVRSFPDHPVSINYATAGGTAVPGVRYTPVSGTLVFLVGQTSATFKVPIIDDGITQGSQTVGLVLSDPSSSATLGIPSTATLTIDDDTRDRTGPTVNSVRFLTRPGGVIKALVVTYSKPIDPTTAVDLVNYGYSVQTAGRDHRFGDHDDLIIPIIAATYDPSSFTATLTLGRGIHPPTPFRFSINESTNVPGVGVGVSDVEGFLLDGNYDGVAGSPFSVVLKGRTGGFVADVGASNVLGPYRTDSSARRRHSFVARRAHVTTAPVRSRIRVPGSSHRPTSSIGG
jgi:hypothetical protein